MQPKWGYGRVGYLRLETNISNRSNTKVEMLFFTIKHCKFLHSWKVMAQGLRWENVCAWKCFYFYLFIFCDLIPHFSSFLSLSFPPFSLAFSCAFRIPSHLSRAWLVLTGLHYECTTVNWTFLVRKFDHFFLTSEAFRALPLHSRELVFILLLPRILPY